MSNRGLSIFEAELLRQELRELRDRNLRESTFEEKADLIAKLGIRILPSEDLKSRKISCRLNLVKENEEREQAGFAKNDLWWGQRGFEHNIECRRPVKTSTLIQRTSLGA